MGEPGQSGAPEGLVVESVDWLPSGARSGLVRVRGRWEGEPAGPGLPVLLIEDAGQVHRHASLPDPRGDRDPGVWRGAYVVHSDLVERARDRLVLEFPGGARVKLPEPGWSGAPPAPRAEPPPRIARAMEPPPEAAPDGDDVVVERAVLAERRARRAEAAEQAQARIAREALRAVEVLEQRGSELEDRLEKITSERDALARIAAEAPAPDEHAVLRDLLAAAEEREAALTAELDAARAAPPAAEGSLEAAEAARSLAERRAERLRAALAATVATVGDLRLQLREAGLWRRTAEVARTADSVRLAVVEAERVSLAEQLSVARAAARTARDDLDAAEVRAAGAEAAHEETRRRFTERVLELRAARERIAELEAEIAAVREDAERRAAEAVDAAVAAAVAEREAAIALREAELEEIAAQREAELAAAHEERERAVAAREAEIAAAHEERERAVAAREAKLAVAAREAKLAVAAREAEWEEAANELRSRLARAEAALVESETAREIAEATRLAASVRHHAAQVALAAGAEARTSPAPREDLQAERDALAGERDAVAGERDAVAAERDALAAERDALTATLATERESLASDRDAFAAALIAERDAATAARDAVIGERDALAAELDSLIAERDALLAERDALAAEPASAADEPTVLEQVEEIAARGAAGSAEALELVRRAAAQAAEAPPRPQEAVPDRERLVADLAAAAEGLRARAAQAAAQPKPEPEPAAEPPAGPTIVSAPGHPPRELAVGRGGREYPPLRGALVKLAHDDPGAAGRLIVGLLPAQWRLIHEPLDYDLTIEGVGTYAVGVAAGGVTVTKLDRPRRRRQAEFHLRTDPATLAEMLAGVGPKPRRLGRARISGKRRRAAALQPVAGTGMSLEAAARAGAELDPVLVLRCLAYAVHPSWTTGHSFTVAQSISGPGGERTVYVTAQDGRGVSVSAEPPAGAPDASVAMTEAAFRHMLRGDPPAPDERPVSRGDHFAVDALRAWADRLRTGDV